VWHENRITRTSRENRGPARVFFRECIIVRRFASSSNKMRLFSCDRDQQYCVKAFHKIRGPRRCNCYRVQVNSDFAQNTVGTRVAAIWMCRHVRNGGRRGYGGPRESGDGGTKRRSDLLNTIRLSTVMTRVCKYYFACTRGQSMTRSLCPPFPLASAGYLHPFIVPWSKTRRERKFAKDPERTSGWLISHARMIYRFADSNI